MKNYVLTAFIVAMGLAFGFQTISAQITINLPKFPKFKKDPPKTDTPKETEKTKPVENSDQTAQTKTSPVSDDPEMDFRLKFFLTEIDKAQKEVDEYTPETKIYLVGGGASTDWLWRAVSPGDRNEFLEKWKTLLTPGSRKIFNDKLDTLSAAAAKKLPLYVASPKFFNFHNPAEEKLMKAELKDPANNKIYKIGLNQTAWLIDKNGLGIPTSRYKHGLIWRRASTSDHPYCYITYINIIQDYAGGGTYGDSYAYYVKDELAGCPEK